MLGRSFNFKIRPSRVSSRRGDRDEKVALFIATLVCIGTYYLFGAGGWMLTLSLLTYIIVRLRQLRTPRPRKKAKT